MSEYGPTIGQLGSGGFRMRYVPYAAMLSVAILSSNSLAQGSNLTAFDPDIVLECFGDNKPARQCHVSCGTNFSQAPSEGPPVTFTGVDRVEIFNRGAEGRLDTRSWIFIRSLSKIEGPAFITSLYAGPSVTCSFQNQIPAPPVLIELRLTKFRFN